MVKAGTKLLAVRVDNLIQEDLAICRNSYEFWQAHVTISPGKQEGCYDNRGEGLDRQGILPAGLAIWRNPS